MAIMNLPRGEGLGTFKVATGEYTTSGTSATVTTGLNTILGFAVTPTSSGATLYATANGGTLTVTLTAAGTFTWIAIGF